MAAKTRVLEQSTTPEGSNEVEATPQRAQQTHSITPDSASGPAIDIIKFIMEREELREERERKREEQRAEADMKRIESILNASKMIKVDISGTQIQQGLEGFKQTYNKLKSKQEEWPELKEAGMLSVLGQYMDRASGLEYEQTQAKCFVEKMMHRVNDEEWNDKSSEAQFIMTACLEMILDFNAAKAEAAKITRRKPSGNPRFNKNNQKEREEKSFAENEKRKKKALEEAAKRLGQ